MEKVEKHITFTVTNDLSYDQRMMRICSTLAEHGYQITLIGRRLKHSKILGSTNYSQKRIRCFFNRGFLFYAEYNIRLFFVLLFTRVDIYGAIDLDTIAPNCLVAIIKSRPFVYDAHEFFTEVPEVTNRSMIKATWDMVGKLCIPQAKLCYTVSESLAEQLSMLYKTSFEVVRNMPLQKASVAKPSKEKILVYQGDLNIGRGLELYIESMQFLDAKLVIIGDGPLYTKLNALAQKLNVSEKVLFTGYKDANSMHEITANASIGLNLLQGDGLSYYYSLSNKFFNYVQAGIPQLCCQFPEYIILNNTYHVAKLISYDTAAIVDACNDWFANNEDYNKTVLYCHQAAKVLNWESEKQTLISLYNEAFAHR